MIHIFWAEPQNSGWKQLRKQLSSNICTHAVKKSTRSRRSLFFPWKKPEGKQYALAKLKFQDFRNRNSGHYTWTIVSIYGQKIISSFISCQSHPVKLLRSGDMGHFKIELWKTGSLQPIPGSIRLHLRCLKPTVVRSIFSHFTSFEFRLYYLWFLSFPRWLCVTSCSLAVGVISPLVVLCGPCC